MKLINVLILTCGTNASYHMSKVIKTQYSKYFRLIGVDINMQHLVASTVYLDEFYQCPYSSDPSYYQFILDLCDQEKIDYIIPGLDIERLLFYSENNDLLKRNIISLGLSIETINFFQEEQSLCFNKIFVYEKLEQCGVKCPNVIVNKNIINDEEQYFVKPIDGYGSTGVGVYLGKDVKKIDLSNYVVQEKCIQPEITVECFCYDGKLSTIARERILSRAGVCVKTRIYHDLFLENIVKKILKKVKMPCYFNVQFMQNTRNEYVVIDLNLRTPGGMSLSYAAGWDVTSALVAIMLNKTTQEIFNYVNSSIDEQYIVRAYADIVTKKVKSKIAFDLDGTLLDSRQRHIKVMEDILKKHKIDLSAEKLVIFKSEGFSNRDWLLSHNVLQEEVEDIVREWIENIEASYYQQFDVLYPRTIPLLKQLSKNNDLYLITARNNRKLVYEKLQELGILTYFNDVCVVDPLDNPALKKSNFIQKYKIDAMIGDTEVDFNAALVAGIKFYATIDGFRSERFWKKYDVELFSGEVNL